MQEFQPIPGLAGRLFGGAALPPEEVRCPRCDSANTKFCYYNNYNLSQPRHFCKTCRRYWTKGGLLRNVPVGGGCRKPKRPAAADVDGSGGAHRYAKNPRSGCTAASSAASASNTVGAAAVVHSSGRSTTATGVGPSIFSADALTLPPPAPMFADQAFAFASHFAPPPQLPAFSFPPQPKAEEDVAPAHTLTEQPSSASSTADHMAPLSVRSGGAAMASATEWPPAAADAARIFDLAGDTSSYWNLASWTDRTGRDHVHQSLYQFYVKSPHFPASAMKKPHQPRNGAVGDGGDKHKWMAVLGEEGCELCMDRDTKELLAYKSISKRKLWMVVNVEDVAIMRHLPKSPSIVSL